MAKVQTETKQQNDLVSLVDEEFETRLYRIYFSKNLDFRYYMKFGLMAFFFFIFLFAVYVLSAVTKALPFTISQTSPTDTLILFLSIVSVFIAIGSFFFSSLEVLKPEKNSEIFENYNYCVLKKKVAAEEYPLLKALVILKSKHPQFPLKEFFPSKSNPLKKKDLFKILYDTKVDERTTD